MKNNPKVTDEKLVGLSIKNPDNFEMIVARYWDRIFRYARRISYFEKEDLEDIVQETFIKVYRNLNSFDDSLKFSTWIYQIAHNAVVDAIRRKNSRPQRANMEDDDLAKFLRSAEDPQQEIVLKENLDKVRKGIRQLPIKYREALILRFLEEKTYDEMVDILKKPKGTVASLVNRGRKMLLDGLPAIQS